MGRRAKRGTAGLDKRVELLFPHSKDGKAELRAHKPQDSQKVHYDFSWTGADGQRGTLTFIQGGECALLPPGCKAREDLEMVTFMAFQLDSQQASAIGRMRYKTAAGTHGKVQPQAVGERVLLAQLLKLNRVPQLAEEPQLPAKRRKLKAAHAGSHVSSQEGAAAEGSSEEGHPAEAARGSNAEGSRDSGDDSAAEEDTAAAGKRVVTDVERKRQKERDRAAAQACERLSGREDWQGDLETEQLGARSFGRFKVAAAAECQGFGIRRYRAIRDRTFFRCLACPQVFRSKRLASNHSCERQERAEAAPRQARQRSSLAAEILPGGLQLNVHLPTEGAPSDGQEAGDQEGSVLQSMPEEVLGGPSNHPLH